MIVGTIGYATDQGLGILIKDFYDHGVIQKVMIMRHHRWVTHREWYPGAPIMQTRPLRPQPPRRFLQGVDVFLIFETPFDWNLLPWCRSRKIATVLCPMYECMPKRLPAQPQSCINPSLLDQQYFDGVFIPIPVSTPWKLRRRAEVFVHNAGHGGLKGRNGTLELLQAMEHVKSPIKLIVRSQKTFEALLPNVPRSILDDDRIDFREGSIPKEELYEEGDVFIFPEKFNGLSLPLQEARASGMLVMSTARFPMTSWLPHPPMIPVAGYVNTEISGRCLTFEAAVIRPVDIAETIDAWYGHDITEYSESGREWAGTMSWDVLKPAYMAELERQMRQAKGES